MRALSLSELLLIELSRSSELPLRRRIFEAVRNAIIDGVLPRGVRLPSSRDLARDLNMSRNTIVSALDQLLAEGYADARVGSGTYVASALPEHEMKRVGRTRIEPVRTIPAVRRAPRRPPQSRPRRSRRRG